MRAWRVHRYGAPTKALEIDELPAPEPEEGEVRVQVAATVLNWNDIDGCYGRYETVKPPLPYVLGMEVVGRVDAAGEGARPTPKSTIQSWTVGQRLQGRREGFARTLSSGLTDWRHDPILSTFRVPI